MNKGDWIQTRRIHLHKIEEADKDQISHCLNTLSGIKKTAISIKNNTLCVRYDMSITDYETIVDALEKVGFVYQHDKWNQAKKAWAKFVDQTARKNSQIRPAACCNRPPHAHK